MGELVTAPGSARPDWMIAAELAVLCGGDLGFESTEEITAEIAALCATHAGAIGAELGADGVVASGAAFEPEFPAEHVAPPRDAYGLRLVCGRKLYDGGGLSIRRRRWRPCKPRRSCVCTRSTWSVSASTRELRSRFTLSAVRCGCRSWLMAVSPVETSCWRSPHLISTWALLIDATAPVTDVRVETRAGGGALR